MDNLIKYNDKLSYKKINLSAPPLEDIRDVLQTGLTKHYEEVNVSVIECPDLREKPFYLAQSGLCGSEKIADIGGPPYLCPTPQSDKKYSFVDVTAILNMQQNAFLIGAGAAPSHVLGRNAELMPNILFTTNQSNEPIVNNQTHYAKVDNNGNCYCDKLDSSEFGLMANLFASYGQKGNVLRVKVKKRITTENYVESIQSVLRAHYGDRLISVGGVFLITSGKAKLHVMPDFSSTPLLTNDDVNNWLKFYNTNSPLICLSVFHSYDPGLDLRKEHTHCFSDHAEGGHYHYDTTPDQVEYDGYFNLAKEVYRIDAPPVTHNVGRD